MNRYPTRPGPAGLLIAAGLVAALLLPLAVNAEEPGMLDQAKRMGSEAWQETREFGAAAAERSGEYYDSAVDWMRENGAKAADATREYYDAASDKAQELYRDATEPKQEPAPVKSI